MLASALAPPLAAEALRQCVLHLSRFTGGTAVKPPRCTNIGSRRRPPAVDSARRRFGDANLMQMLC